MIKKIKSLFRYEQWVILIWGLSFVLSMQICILWSIKTKSFKSDMMKENGQQLPKDYIRFPKQAIKEFYNAN